MIFMEHLVLARLSEVLYHTFNLCNQLWQRHYDCGRSAHRETVACKGWVTFFFCAVFESWWFQGKGDTHTNHALMYGCAKTWMGIQGPLL